MARRNDEIDAEWSAYVKRLATMLRQARDDARLSQEEVAYGAGLTRYTYQKYEKGESRLSTPANPTLRSFLALSQVLGVPVAALIPRRGARPSQPVANWSTLLWAHWSCCARRCELVC